MIICSGKTFSQTDNSDSLLTAFKGATSDKNKLAFLIDYCDKYKYTYPDSCLKYATTYFNSYKWQLSDENFKLMRLLGDVHWHMGDMESALARYDTILSFHRKRSNIKEMGQSLGDMGYIKMEQGKYPEALVLYKEALKHARSCNDTEYEGIVGLYIAQLYDWIGEYKESLKMYHEMLALFAKGKSKRSHGIVLMNIGAVHGNRKQTDSALIYYNKALEVLPESEEKSRAVVKMNIAFIYILKKQDLKFVRGLMDEAIPVFEKLNSQSNLALSNYIEGIYFVQRKDLNKAKNYFKKAIGHYKTEGNWSRLSLLYDKLAEVYEQQGSIDSAYVTYKLFKQASDSVLTGLAADNMSYQKVMFDMDKKQMEIKVLEQNQLIQKEQLDREKIQRYAMYGGILLLIFFGSFMYNRFQVTKKQKWIIELKEQETQFQKHLIEEKQKEILDSINYAKRIQYTLLAHREFLKANLPDHFVFFAPKDIVSGDFYWANKQGDKFYFAICDSTGHGVPGAFMSLLNISFLNEAVNEKRIEKPNEIFNFVRTRLIENISKDGQKDGFDGILICIDLQSNRISYAAANNAPVLIRNNTVEVLNADRMPVGVGERKDEFQNFEINIEKGDSLYLYTDGYADQFGGPKGKKFKYKKLNEELLANCNKPMNEQFDVLEQTFMNWKGNLEQIDDVCLVGIKWG